MFCEFSDDFWKYYLNKINFEMRFHDSRIISQIIKNNLYYYHRHLDKIFEKHINLFLDDYETLNLLITKKPDYKEEIFDILSECNYMGFRKYVEDNNVPMLNYIYDLGYRIDFCKFRKSSFAQDLLSNNNNDIDLTKFYSK